MSVEDLELSIILWKIYFSITKQLYHKTVIEITAKYYVGTPDPTWVEEDVENSILRYLFATNPWKFSVVGNLNITEDEEQCIDFVWGNDKFSSAKQLYGINTTNCVQGECNAYIHSNIWHGTSLNGVFKFLQQCAKVRADILAEHDSHLTATVTLNASTFINCEKDFMINQQSNANLSITTNIKCYLQW
jgi:hypothetical protein